MFVITEKETEMIWFVDQGKTRMILCRNETAAIKAVEKLAELTKKEFSYAKLDKRLSSRLWYLENQEGKKHELEPGIRVAFRTNESAWNFAGSVCHQTSKILLPVPA